jgi:K+-sensing histidine kinase KdpD
MIDTVQQQLISEGLQEAKQLMQTMKQKALKLANTDLLKKIVEIEDTLRNIDDINNISTEALQVETCSLKTLIDTAYQMYHLYFTRQDINFSSYVTNLQVKVDKMSFYRMFFTLVHYMGKHAHPNEERSISIEAAAYNTKTIALYIEDNGAYPINETNPFEQPFKRRITGAISGVGIPAIQQWATSIGGKVYPVDKPTRGLKLCFLLPGTANPYLKEQPKQAIAPNPQNKEYTPSW